MNEATLGVPKRHVPFHVRFYFPRKKPFSEINILVETLVRVCPKIYSKSLVAHCGSI